MQMPVSEFVYTLDPSIGRGQSERGRMIGILHIFWMCIIYHISFLSTRVVIRSLFQRELKYSHISMGKSYLGWNTLRAVLPSAISQ
jgi:hypothetical protein